MDDIGLKLTFEDTKTSVAFAQEVERADLAARPFRIATFEPRLNFDAETLLLALKLVGAATTALTGFLKLSQEILKLLKKSSMKIELDGKRIELEASAKDEEVRKLADVLLPPQR